MSQLRAINLMNSLEAVASGLYGIFVPIFLLTSGFDLQSVFIYLSISHLGIVPFFALAAKSCERFGLRKTMLWRFFFLFFYFISLLYLDKFNFLLYVSAVLGSLQASFFYYPQHFIFASHAGDHEMGKRVALLYNWPQIVNILMPLVSSLIAIIFGLKNLFIVSLFVYFFASFYAYKTIDEIKIRVDFSWQRFKNFLTLNRKHLKFLVIENIRGDIQGVIWPVIFFYRNF